LTPKLSNLALKKGWERLFSSKALMEFLKNVLSLTAIGTLCFFILKPELRRMDVLTGIGMQGVLLALSEIISTILMWVCGTIFFFAVLDYGFQYFMHLKKMRMSHQEIKEEYKQTEGDPQIKGRIKQLRYQQHQRQTLKSVESATVLITNPTHFAVALKWDESNMSAPVVVAKGADFLALKMREVASHHDIPIIENPPLARSLYSNLKISQEIKPEYYKAIAEVIRFILGITKGAYYGREEIEEKEV
jgi:flagellar biosynthetic protein FlhB